MKLLALDPATCTGWAWQDTDSPDLPLYGAWRLAATGDDSGRLVRLREHVYAIKRSKGIDLLAFEDASFGSHNPHVQAMHNELRGVIKLAAHELGVRAISVGPMTLKAFVAGNGRAKKPAVIAAVERHLGIRTQDDNVADALAVLLWAKAYPDGMLAKPPRRRARSRKATERRLFPSKADSPINSGAFVRPKKDRLDG